MLYHISGTTLFRLNLNKITLGWNNLGTKTLPAYDFADSFIYSFGGEEVYYVKNSDLYKFDTETEDFVSKGSITGFPGRKFIVAGVPIPAAFLSPTC